MRSFVAVAVAALTAVSAQNFTIDPDEVSLSTRSSWCQGESASCTTLCDGNPKTNACAPETLVYSCTCQNGSAPGLEYYSQTIPSFICQQAFTDCNLANVGDATGQKNCTTSIQDHCGTLDTANYTPAATTTSASASGSASATATAASESSSAASTASAAAPHNVQNLGTGTVAVAMGVLAYLL